MKNFNGRIDDLYLKDEYITHNPSLHEEDSPWKIHMILPLVDAFVNRIRKDEIRLLDVGGGAGLILGAVSEQIRSRYSIRVSKLTLDLSPGMLEVQRHRNPDLVRSLNEDICSTSLASKEIDLTLMIDVLEHIPNPVQALEEVKRISNYVIFKVPLEDSLFDRLNNFLQGANRPDRKWRRLIHVNVYRFNQLRQQIEAHVGQILDFTFTNIHAYFISSEHYRARIGHLGRLSNFVAAHIFRLAPKFSSLIFGDSVVILVKCYQASSPTTGARTTV